tara:strand:- start:2134 stop:2571 length:438 start_codon:yes stop_codon:yes gene_type:complete
MVRPIKEFMTDLRKEFVQVQNDLDDGMSDKYVRPRQEGLAKLLLCWAEIFQRTVDPPQVRNKSSLNYERFLSRFLISIGFLHTAEYHPVLPPKSREAQKLGHSRLSLPCLSSYKVWIVLIILDYFHTLMKMFFLLANFSLKILPE